MSSPSARSETPPARIAVVTCAVLELEIAHFVKECPQVIHVEVLEQGLHNEPDRLRRELQAAIDRVEAQTGADVIVLGYGLCSRGTENVFARRCRMVIARAHDCITLLLGSKERYAQYVKEHPGTYWYSPGWNRHHVPPGEERYRKLYREYCEKYGEDNAQYLMETEQRWFKTYDRAAYVDLGVGDTGKETAYTRRCAKWLNWSFDCQRGDPALLRALLAGPWDNEHFLVLEPGQTFRMTADERIVEAVPGASGPVRLEVESSGGHRVIDVAPADRARRLTEILRNEHLPLNVRCGERGKCDGCRLEIISGAVVHVRTGAVATGGVVRGCEHRIGSGGAALRIPPRSELAYEPQVVAEFRVNIPRAQDPLWQCVEIGAGESVRETVWRKLNHDQTVRLAEGVPATSPGAGFARLEFYGDHWRVTGLDPARPGRALGAAVDVGTTTVALQLVDLRDGSIVGFANGFNRQLDLGDDVATRIGLCAGNPGMVGRLRAAILDRTIRPLLAAANGGGDPVVCLAVAGNTTMLHLLAGVDPSPMGVYPFTPGFLGYRVIGTPPMHLLPGAAAYVGADLVAGILATGMAYEEGPSLLVDIGTNGEIILKKGEQLIGCATAAGPAFEGAGLTSGMRAGAGAIEHIRFGPQPFEVEVDVIGRGVPRGICGSAYLDFLAGARRIGLINERGRFNSDTPAFSSGHFTRLGKRGLSLRLARGPGGSDVAISESDIATLLQAKAAIAAGVLTLLERARLAPADVERLYLAGGFGMRLDVSNAILCGLLPGFEPHQVQVVGNTSLAGAHLALLDAGVLDELARISGRLEVVELNLDPGFASRYVDQLALEAV